MLSNRWRHSVLVLALASASAGAVSGILYQSTRDDSGPPSAIDGAMPLAANPRDDSRDADVRAIGPATVPHDGVRIIEVHGRLPAGYGRKLATLVERYPVVVLGTVSASQTRTEPAEDGFPADNYTLHTFQVERWVSSETPGRPNELTVRQEGGPTADGALIVYEADTILAKGGRYLLFLRQVPGSDQFIGAPFGRFPVENGRLRPLNAEVNGLRLGAVDALIGKTVEAAVDEVEVTAQD